MSGFSTIDGVSYDELFGGSSMPVHTKNVTVGANAVIKRGMVLAETNGVYALAVAADNEKPLVIAKEDFTATTSAKVTTAYTSGVFNREKLTLGDGANIANFEEQLRKDNILLTSIREGY